MELLLKSWNVNVVSATSLSDVRTRLDNFKPDILISDYWLRNGETGNMVVAFVNDYLGYEIPSIYITGTTSKRIENDGGSSDVSVLLKPIDAEQLRNELIRLMTIKNV